MYSADGKYEVSYKPNAVVYNDGKIMWIPIAIYQSSCIIDVEYFPFDEQRCKMVFGSWTFNAEQVTLGWYEGEPKVRILYIYMCVCPAMSARCYLLVLFDASYR